MSSHKLTAALTESVEIEVNAEITRLMSERDREALGIGFRRIGGGASFALREGNRHKALGFGFTEPVTEELIAEVIDFHRGYDSTTIRIQLAPEVLPPNWDEICAVHGLTAGGSVVKLVGDVDSFTPGTTDLRIEPITPAQAGEWKALLAQVFGLPEGFAAANAATAGMPGSHPYAAWDGDDMVAVANLFVHGEVGSLHSDATRESHRGRGAQSALLAARARAAAAAGCRWLVSETDRPEPGGSNPSLNNMIRSGLTPSYDRQNWIWQAESGATTTG